MARIQRTDPVSDQEAAEYAADRQAAAAGMLKSTGEKISSASFNALMLTMSALRKRREAIGISQGELAEKMGTDQAVVSRLEGFKVVNPTVFTLVQWAEALGCTIGLGLQIPAVEGKKAAAKRSA